MSKHQKGFETNNANFAEIGHVFGMKTAACSGKSATPVVALDLDSLT
jgi:hypothetical protein